MFSYTLFLLSLQNFTHMVRLFCRYILLILFKRRLRYE
nr:MAG TPA: hypothetical protein [Caudoviricetes sp.]